jgi:Protein of unknown function (DUF4232)
VKLTKRGGRIAAIAAACAAIAVPAIALASVGGKSAATPHCTSTNTFVWLALAPNGAAGTIYYPLEFTNLGSATCTLTGYPGVAAINGAGHKLGPAAVRVGAPVHTLTLKAHQTVHAVLGIEETGAVGCHAVTAAGLQVYPPNQKGRQVVASFTFMACPHKVYLRIYPVTPGIGVP